MEWFEGKIVFEIDAEDYEFGEFENVKGWRLVGQAYSMDNYLVLLFKDRNKYARVWY